MNQYTLRYYYYYKLSSIDNCTIILYPPFLFHCFILSRFFFILPYYVWEGYSFTWSQWLLIFMVRCLLANELVHCCLLNTIFFWMPVLSFLCHIWRLVFRKLMQTFWSFQQFSTGKDSCQKHNSSTSLPMSHPERPRIFLQASFAPAVNEGPACATIAVIEYLRKLGFKLTNLCSSLHVC